MIALYSLVLLVSAALLFLLDPMVGKFVLPLLGSARRCGPRRCCSSRRRCCPAGGSFRMPIVRDTWADVEAELAALLDRCRTADTDLVVQRRTLLVREPFEVAPDEDIVTAVAAAAAETDGGEHPIAGASYWADAAFISAAGIPTVVYGPGGEGAHELVEWVSISETETVARTLASVASRMCA